MAIAIVSTVGIIYMVSLTLFFMIIKNKNKKCNLFFEQVAFFIFLIMLLSQN